MTNEQILEPYKVDVYGNVRSEFETVQVALNDSVDNIALVHRALNELGAEMTTNEHTQILTAATKILAETVATMNVSLTILADCERR